MPRLTANPEVEASASFDVVKPCTAQMRVDSIEEFTAQSGSTCWRLRASYVNGHLLEKLDDSGPASNPGTIMDSGLVIAPPEKQGKTRGFVEACGKEWTDLDSEDLLGLEFEAKIGLDEYKGEQKNVIKRYLAPNV